jgi:diadenosine tetraphosphate (Ap4A) HIT family hydrolase
MMSDEDGCPFCRMAGDRVPEDSPSAMAFPDAFPIAAGHTLVVPRRHVASIFDLAPAEQAELWRLVAQVRRELGDRFHPDGFNIGVNDGPAAGQTIFHAHIQVIPRYHGDVADPRGGIRWVIPDKAAYWEPVP